MIVKMFALAQFEEDLAHPVALDGHPGEADDVERLQGVEVDVLDVLVDEDDLVTRVGSDPASTGKRQDRHNSPSYRGSGGRGSVPKRR